MAHQQAKRRIRAPDVTRNTLLQAGFAVIYRCGFQGASLDDILKQSGVTKGALYHHFADKSALGYAVVNEVIRGLLLERWIGPLRQRSGDPLTGLQDVLRDRAANVTTIEAQLGCPLNNLAQEMSPLDERFRRAIDSTFSAWKKGFAQTLERGQRTGTVRRNVDAQRVATFLVAAIEGSYGLAKSTRSRGVL